MTHNPLSLAFDCPERFAHFVQDALDYESGGSLSVGPHKAVEAFEGYDESAGTIIIRFTEFGYIRSETRISRKRWNVRRATAATEEVLADA